MAGIVGRPPYQPTEADRNTVKMMAACGCTQESIARCIGTDGINAETLRTHFRRELDTAMDMANAKVGQVAFQKAVEGEAWAVCFWLKTRAGWRETQTHEHVGAGGSQLIPDRVRDVILVAMEHHPEARQQVAQKLLELEAASAPEDKP